MKWHLIQITEEGLERKRNNDELRADQPYAVRDRKGHKQYAWSPDGIGCFWYDTYREMKEQHA